MEIDHIKLQQLDLNLLIALDVLIEEAGVSKAAERLNMSQSTMSYSLKKLRTILDDDILIRTSRQMEVTPYAREIGDRLKQILVEIQGTLLEKETFDPISSDETFRIALSDYTEATIGTNLIQAITTQAPNIRIRINNLNKETVMDALDENRVDLAIDTHLSLKSWHVSEDLYREEFVCVLGGDDAVDEMSLNDYVARKHILVSLRDDFEGASDRILERQQQSRRVVWSTSHFMSVPFLLDNSDCVALLPRRMAEQCAKTMSLRIFPPPIPVEGFTVSMVWHQRKNNSPQHQWLRQQILDSTVAIARGS